MNLPLIDPPDVAAELCFGTGVAAAGVVAFGVLAFFVAVLFGYACALSFVGALWVYTP